MPTVIKSYSVSATIVGTMPTIKKSYAITSDFLAKREHDLFMTNAWDWISERHEYKDRITGHSNPVLLKAFNELFKYDPAQHGNLHFLRMQVFANGYELWDTHRKIISCADAADGHFYDVLVVIPDEIEAVLFKLTVT